VAKAARRIATLFGSPQDVEWAIAGGRLHILQARPITALSLRAAGVRVVGIDIDPAMVGSAAKHCR